MTGCRARSVNPVGLVLNECPFEGDTFAEALACARRLAARLAAPALKASRGGWCVDLLDAPGQLLPSVPFVDVERRRGAA